jgi:acetate kinase
MLTPSGSYILTINCGSSSLKFSLWHSQTLTMELSGSVALSGPDERCFHIQDKEGRILQSNPVSHANIRSAVLELTAWLLSNRQQYPLIAIGHRIVQGGPDHRAPEIIAEGLLKTLHQLIYLAPNHLPDEIHVIKLFQSTFPGIRQVACFDTFFHSDLPACAKYYPLPEVYRKQGLIRYGFHGLSYEYITAKLAEKDAAWVKRKIIIAHLGNGASITAVKNGISIDTTMGLSPVGGLVMGTRSGDLDPGVLLYLLKQEQLTPDQLDELLSKKAGLLAIAGTSNMQTLLLHREADQKAQEAITLFCYQVKKNIGAMAAAMGGLDMMVFTGGIGENCPLIREYSCNDLEFLGVSIDHQSNQRNHRLISTSAGRVKIQVIATDEESMIAKHTYQFTKDQISIS